MTQDFSRECLADGLEIDHVDFVQCRDVLDSGAKIGESLREEFIRFADSDINIGMRFGSALGPGADVSPENDGTSKLE